MVGQRRRKMNGLSLRDVAIRLLGREERRCLEDIRAQGRVKGQSEEQTGQPWRDSVSSACVSYHPT
jgi:hypothetical protein